MEDAHLNRFRVVAICVFASAILSAAGEGSASVEVSPSIVIIQPGEIAQLTAIVRDESGQPVEAAPVSWGSSRPAVATVDGNGLVTAVSEGTARIEVSSGDQRASISLAVRVDPAVRPLPRGGELPNRPADHQTITEHRGDPWPEGWNRHDPGDNVTAENVADQPVADALSLRFRFREGLRGGNGPGGMNYGSGSLGQRQNMTLNGTPPREIYIAYWYRVSPNWETPGTTTFANGQAKMFYAWAVQHSRNDLHPNVTGQAKTPGAPMVTQITNAFGWADEEGNTRVSVENLNANVNRVPIVPGEWHLLEFIFSNARANDVRPGVGHGSVRWWVNGVLVGDHPEVRRPNHGFTQLQWHPIWGGGGDPTQSEFYAWYNHIYLSGKE